MRNCFLLFSCMLSLLSYGQTDQVSQHYSPPIKIDSVTRKTSAPLPFDRAFILQYDLKKETVVDAVAVYEADIKKGDRKILLDTVNGVRNLNDKYLDTFYKSNATLNIQLKYLPPNTLVDILLLIRPSSEELAPFYVLNEKLYNLHRSRAVVDSNVTDYGAVVQTLRSKQYTGFNRLVSKMSLPQYDSFFNADLYTVYDSLRTFSITSNIPHVNTQSLSLADSVVRSMRLDNSALIRLFQALQNRQLQNISSGVLRLGTLEAAGIRVPVTDYQKRIDNIKATDKLVDTLIFLINAAKLNYSSAVLVDLSDDLTVYKVNYLRYKDFLERQVKAINSFYEGKRRLDKDEWILSGNDFTDLTTKSKYLLVPDLGLTTMFLGGRDKVHFVPRPFLGTNIYFRPVDKNLRERTLPYRDWRRVLSLQLGLTVGSFESTEFTNLFNSFSLLVGPSFKLNRSLRLSPGLVLYRTSDKNPIVSKQTVTASGYFALSFDVDILSNASSRTTTVFK